MCAHLCVLFVFACVCVCVCMYGECVCSHVCVYVCVVGECVFTCVCSCVHTHMCVVGECCTLYLLYSHRSYVHMYYLFHTSGQPTYRACVIRLFPTPTLELLICYITSSNVYVSSPALSSLFLLSASPSPPQAPR